METSLSSVLPGYKTGAAQAAIRASEAAASNQETAAVSRNAGKDSVTISDAAKEFGKIMAKGRGETVPNDSESQDPIEKIKKKIEELEKKIAQVEQSSVPDATKQGVVKGLETELASLRQQLSQLMAQASKPASSGGKAG
ncbi:MAG: hypothetical protein ACOZEN_09700 [Thermodesulfobacteriota bacterium]